MFATRAQTLALVAGVLLLGPVAGMNRLAAQPPPPEQEALPDRMSLPDFALRLGVRLQPDDQDRLVIEAVRPDSPAEKLNLQRDDVLAAVERQPVTARTRSIDIIAAGRPEKKVALTVVRNGRFLTRTTPLPPRPARVKAPLQPPLPPDVPRVSFFGLTAVENAQGRVVVAAVTPDSAADLAGIQPGDVLESIENRAVGSLVRLAEVADTIALTTDAGDAVRIEGRRDGSDQTFLLIVRQRDLEDDQPPAADAPEPLSLGRLAEEVRRLQQQMETLSESVETLRRDVDALKAEPNNAETEQAEPQQEQ